MIKYVNKVSHKTAIIISDKAAGMCEKTLGLTLVIYKYEEDSQAPLFVMKSSEFYQKHRELKS